MKKMMKKMRFLMVLGLGFLLGSKAGSGPYEQVEARVRSLISRSEVQNAVEQVKSAAGVQVDEMAQRVGQQVEKVSGSGQSEGASSESSNQSVPGMFQSASSATGAQPPAHLHKSGAGMPKQP
jgi:hypothetical protein